MKIKINLNDMKFRYDIYQMFNIFYTFDDIDFVEEDEEYKIFITEDSIEFSLKKKDYNKVKSLLGDNKKEIIKKFIFENLSNITGEKYPWGTLVGIRPSKIAFRLLKEGKSDEDIIEYFKNTYDSSKDKAELCIEVAKREEEFVNKDENSISIYVGMPFCPTRCLYCSFASNPIKGCEKLVDPYLEALSYEIDKIKEYVESKNISIETVYFGGGTPTAVNDIQFHNILKRVYNSFVKNKNIKEFTVECGRPDSITEKKLLSMKEFNVSRISINPQSMNDNTLKEIGRHHSVLDVKEKFNLARKLGFNNINMDIIVGLPKENYSNIKRTCEEIKLLNPESLTVHGMSIKRASRLHENIILNKEVNIPNQDELNTMYNETKYLAKELNMNPYYMYRQKNMVGNMENVGFSKEGMECIYNIEMIEDKQSIIALGADAVSKVVFLREDRIERFANVKDVREYVKRVEEMVKGKIQLLDTLYK
ncbi:coproporphyrinogen III oxidase [Clostridium fallax]|uniref:Coproporphyrinogen III oxidase, anaerobic n=1 Tax=Clostridium fallax TaxID=1533 RepID=A0A1M4UCN3_9CLOT|nr:coproporphyrinogen III oxidase [Clostridium fallax]SHE54367.1 coproporphyrinogen III oxidase, anaerobic [Clostridium fallax]SQB06186.1 coproporphyrinogen III oxidase [Clostridium fallax]